MGKFFRLAALWQLLKREASMVLLLLRNPAAPMAAKLLAVAAFAYFFMPIDFITDFIPIIGWIDDAIIIMVLLKLAYKLLPPELYEQLKRKAEARSGTADTQAASR